MQVDGAIKNLIQGVSQQPARSRIQGQCSLQENFSSNPVEGLKRRPPSEWLADLFTDATAQQFYEYELEGQIYIVAAGTGTLRVFDLTGTEYTVNETGAAFDYLDGGKLNFATLEERTFVANTTKTVEMLSTTKSYKTNASIVYILGGNYGKKYTIKVNVTTAGVTTTTTVTHTCPNGSVATHINEVTTTWIAEKLYDLLVAAAPANVTFTRVDDHILINGTSSASTVVVQTADDSYDTLMKALNNSAKQTTHVSKYAPHGYIVSINSGNTADAPVLYLEFRVTPNPSESLTVGSHFGREGTWYESVAPDIPYLMDTTTMPHVLTFDEGTGEFTFAAGEWLGRQVGNEDSNAGPSFLNTTIKFMSYFQGRLVMLTGINTVMSRSNDPFDYFVRSAVSEVDDDPIDIKSTAKNVSALLTAVPFNRDLIVFANNAQFIVFGRTSLTPKNAALVLTTTFESELNAPPVAAGRNIFFAINYGRFTGVREFYTEGSEDINDARPITEHVPKYMEGTVTKLSTTSNFNMLVAQTSVSSTALFVYEYIWAGATKLQSSWSKWIMPNTVSHSFFIESIIYMVVKIGNNYSFEKLDLDTQMDTDINYQVLVDRKSSAVAVDDTLTLPYTDTPDIDDMIFVQGSDCPNPGLRAEVQSYNAGTKVVTFKRDYDGGTIHFGEKYLSRYRPTMPFVKDSDGVKVGTGKLVIAKFLVNYRDSAEMNFSVLSKYAPTISFYFSGRIANDPNTVVGVAPIQSGSYIVPFRENADIGELEIFSDAETPLTMQDIEWIGDYIKQGKRISQGA